MPHDDTTSPAGARRAITRRDAMRWLGGTLASTPLLSLLGCELGSPEDHDAGSAANDASTANDAGMAAHDASAHDASSAASAASDASAAGGWASGGTAAMTALATYPNPFSGAVDPACTPTCAMTEGPCHDDQAGEREDISDGQPGLPMRFALRILDEACEPVSDADVDIWHCDVRGVYSSQTADNPAFCTGDDAAALAARWFRGHRATDADGVAWFSSCFPGWYSGRAIHVHFTVRRTTRQGDEYLTSQVAFPVDLINQVCASHPDYAAHGLPNTSNTSDSVFPADSVDDYVMEVQRMSDGALLAYKTIIIRSSLSASVCAAGGSTMGGPGGMGAPPRP